MLPLAEEYAAYEFNDKSSGGLSSSEVESDENAIKFRYELKKGFAYPYAGVAIEKVDSTLIDIQNFEFLKLNIRSDKGRRIPITFQVEDKAVSAQNIPFQYQIQYDPSVNEYQIPLSKFAVPKWWYEDSNISDHLELKSYLKKIASVNVENCILLPTDQKDEIEIKEITFSQDLKALKKTLYLCLFVMLGGTVAVFIWRIKKRTISYAATEIREKSTENFDVLSFIKNNYMDPQLSIETIKSESGFSEKKIASDLKASTEMSFKQLLNQLRIVESKRLLSESSLSISEIAYQIGYNNVSHFNRVFKSMENCSPSDFREKL